MTILTSLLAAAPAASANAGQPGASSASFWIMIVVMFAIMYFFMIRPQRKAQKEAEKFRRELKKGDKVVTAGGIYGTVAEIDEKTLLILVDHDVKIKVDKNSVGRDFTAQQ